MVFEGELAVKLHAKMSRLGLAQMETPDKSKYTPTCSRYTVEFIGLMSPPPLHALNTAPPLHFHCSITAPPWHRHCTASALPLHRHYTTTALLPHFHCATTAPSLHHHCTATALPPQNHSTATALPLHRSLQHGGRVYKAALQQYLPSQWFRTSSRMKLTTILVRSINYFHNLFHVVTRPHIFNRVQLVPTGQC